MSYKHQHFCINNQNLNDQQYFSVISEMFLRVLNVIFAMNATRNVKKRNVGQGEAPVYTIANT